MSYARPYDENRMFFDQVKELYRVVPQPALTLDYPTLVNSEYLNHTGNCRNAYLMFDTDFCEDVSYGTTVTETKDSLDMSIVRGSQLCYECINCERCYQTFFSEDCTECHNVVFSKNLTSCTDCFGCINLKNKSFCIFNKQYTKEIYQEEMKKINVSSFAGIESLREKSHNFWNGNPHKYMHGRHSVNVIGDYVYNSKNSFFVYQVMNLEDSKYCCRMATINIARETYDYFEWGNNAERIYECITVGQNAQNIRFCHAVFDGVSDIEYSFWCMASSTLFGCVGLRKKSNCILNMQYTKESFDKLRARIVEEMKSRPFVDAKGIVYRYGEFFPYELSAYAYNESTAMQYTPLDRDEIEKAGWTWRTLPQNEYSIKMRSGDIPDNINDVSDDFTKEIIACAKCAKAYRVIPMELEFLKRFSIAIPRMCPECRHMRRFSRISKPVLYHRRCMKEGCSNEFETSYALDRPEIIYCESCYQQEVI